MFRIIKYELNPTKSQKDVIKQSCECCRIVYNIMLEQKIKTEKEKGLSIQVFDLTKQLSKLKSEKEFLKVAPSQALSSAIFKLDADYTRFKIKNPTDFPNFKKKKMKGCYIMTVPCTIDYNNWTIKVAKIGTIKFFKGHNKPINGDIKWYKINYTPTDRYFITVGYETNDSTKLNNNKSVGIDVGIKNLATLSDGNIFENPKYYDSNLEKLRVLEMSVKRKYQKDKTIEQQSNNWKKAVKKLAKLREHIACQRRDYLHKVSSQISKKYSTVCLETLDLNEMFKNSYMAYLIKDCGWEKFLKMLEYKCDNIVKVDEYYASSQICFECGYKEPKIKNLKIREWTCPNCGTHHDRDLNAAKNIERTGLSILRNRLINYNIFDPRVNHVNSYRT